MIFYNHKIIESIIALHSHIFVSWSTLFFLVEFLTYWQVWHYQSAVVGISDIAFFQYFDLDHAPFGIFFLFFVKHVCSSLYALSDCAFFPFFCFFSEFGSIFNIWKYWPVGELLFLWSVDLNTKIIQLSSFVSLFRQDDSLTFKLD